MKIDRMIGILSILLQKDKTTIPELAQHFEVSERTISRDLDSLGMAGIPLTTSRGTGGGVSIMDGYRIDRTVLTGSEMQAILAGLKGLDSVSGTNRYAQLMEKLSAGSSDVLPVGSHILINLASWSKTRIADQMERIGTAIEQHRRIHFHYASPSGESDRILEPAYLLFEWSSWYVYGFDLTREDWRLFKLSRATDLTLGESFSPKVAPMPDLSNDRVFPEHIRLRALVQPQYRFRIIEEYGADAYTEQADGRLLFSFGFTNREHLLSWVLSFGEGIELLEPRELRSELRSFGEMLSEMYRET